MNTQSPVLINIDRTNELYAYISVIMFIKNQMPMTVCLKNATWS